MTILIICLHIIVCIVLILVILLQAGRGQGLTGASFGGNVQSLLGTKANSFLTKATSGCAIVFLFTCIGLNILEVKRSHSLYQAPQSRAPLDVNQIKKALEKLKKTEAAKTAAVPSATAPWKTAPAAAAKTEAPKP